MKYLVLVLILTGIYSCNSSNSEHNKACFYIAKYLKENTKERDWFIDVIKVDSIGPDTRRFVVSQAIRGNPYKKDTVSYVLDRSFVVMQQD